MRHIVVVRNPRGNAILATYGPYSDESVAVDVRAQVERTLKPGSGIVLVEEVKERDA